MISLSIFLIFRSQVEKNLSVPGKKITLCGHCSRCSRFLKRSNFEHISGRESSADSSSRYRYHYRYFVLFQAWCSYRFCDGYLNAEFCDEFLCFRQKTWLPLFAPPKLYNIMKKFSWISMEPVMQQRFNYFWHKWSRSTGSIRYK